MGPKPKLTKKELDRKKKEEEDRKQLEEEEARLRAEQEDKERIKREKIEAEEHKKVEKKELKIRSVELEEFRNLLSQYDDKLMEYKENHQLQYAWERYLLCDGSPDPTIPHEINTYINLWREDDKNITIEPVMSEGSLCLRLISELESLIEDYKSNETFSKDINRYEETIKELQLLLQEKIDLASLVMLSKAKMLVENETCNLEKIWNYNQMTLCLWGNIAKTSKVTKLQFPDIGMSIFIPKCLTSMDIAFRVFFTKYDHHSSFCKFYKLRPKVIEKIEVVEENNEVTEVIVVPEIEETIEQEKSLADELNLLDELNKVSIIEEPEKEDIVPEQEENIESPPEDRISSPETIEWEEFDGENDVIDLRNCTPIGGLFQINMVNMPPQPKVVKNWTMTQQVVPPKMTRFEYDVTSEKVLVKKQSSLDTTERENQSSTPKDRVSQNGPIKILIKLPETVILADQPTLGLWNETEKVWKTGNVVIIDNKEEEKNITFEIYEFGIVGIFQDFHINMPFQSWTMRPYHVPKATTPALVHGTEESTVDTAHIVVEDVVNNEDIVEELDYNPDSKHQILLVINAAIFDVRLHICDNRVRILPDDEHTELNGLAGQWYSVRELIKVMRFAGINIFPREDSVKYVTITEKNSVAENRLYDQMALLCPSVAFSSSRWNSQNKSTDAIIVLASEHLNSERPVNEDDWSVLSFTRKKVEKLKMMEYDEKFSAQKDDRIEFHSNLFHFYQDFGCEEGMVAVKNIDCHFYDTMRSLLKAIRPAVFT